MGYRPISDYGIIGNDDRCALIGTNGAIDWACFPNMASPSVFGRLLDEERGGHFVIEPTNSYTSTQRYIPRTNVLETRFETDSGAVSVTDFMPATARERSPEYQRAIYRHVECERGDVRIEVDVKPQLDYGRADTGIRETEAGIRAEGDEEFFAIQSHGSVSLEALDERAVGWATLGTDDSCWFVVQHDHHRDVSPSMCHERKQTTVDYWQEWTTDLVERAEDIAGDHENWADAIIRSGLVLKLLINEGSGAIYAAATTSLPEKYGRSENWDYRYNWIRDAKFTIQALFNLGQIEEAHEYFAWFRELSHEGPESMQPVYGVHGEEELPETTLDHLDGYRFSTPVRIGNDAAEQRQLDIYGAIVQGIYETLLHDGQLTEEDWDSVCAIVDHVCDVWDERDAGIWEYREEPRHYVHSKLLCWVALDRGIELAEYHDEQIDTSRWEEERSTIRDAIETHGYSESAESFVQHFDTDETIDASSLLIPIYEFLPPDDPRVEATIDTVEEKLLTDGGLVARTDGPDGRDEGPGAFLFCSFWLIDALVLSGRESEARELFEQVLDHLDQPYLLAERIDPTTGEAYGNFPQAFSHIGLVNSAIYLQGATEGHDIQDGPLEDKKDPVLFRS